MTLCTGCWLVSFVYSFYWAIAILLNIRCIHQNGSWQDLNTIVSLSSARANRKWRRTGRTIRFYRPEPTGRYGFAVGGSTLGRASAAVLGYRERPRRSGRIAKLEPSSVWLRY